MTLELIPEYTPKSFLLAWTSGDWDEVKNDVEAFELMGAFYGDRFNGGKTKGWCWSTRHLEYVLAYIELRGKDFSPMEALTASGGEVQFDKRRDAPRPCTYPGDVPRTRTAEDRRPTEQPVGLRE